MKKDINQLVTGIINNTDLRRPIRAKSLVATIFGDFIDPYGGRIWLGNLIELVKLFDINERLMRTSIYRLAEEGWVTKTREGRRSIYILSFDGREQTALAGELIYHYKQKKWNGVWNFVISTSKEISPARINQLHHRLSLMGFGVLSKNIFAHPDMDNELVNKVIRELGLEKQVPVMQSRTISPGREKQDYDLNRELVKQCCPYDEADKLYNHFINAYRPVLAVLNKKQSISNDLCFKIRVLLIHDYRRLLFRDPQLPAELLPAKWSGKIAWEIVRELYLLTWRQANSYYLSICKDNVIKPRLKNDFFNRFGGLDKDVPVNAL